ncbi:adenylyltransferase/cytidyltransferase family protein [bacterium]|nr:adenylyltransferase/cytidyltransferase family protein [bacterium]
MAFGSFDVMHPGHLYFLKEAKKKGDKLIVVIAKESTIQKIKNFTPKYSEHERLEHVRDMPMVDKAVLGYEKDPYEIVEEYNPDIICIGYDQNSYSANLEEELRKRELKAKVIRLGAYKPEIYKSSKLK